MRHHFPLEECLDTFRIAIVKHTQRACSAGQASAKNDKPDHHPIQSTSNPGLPRARE
jgi:hypothetical protein